MVNFKFKDIELEFETNEKVFSPSAVDKGTLDMIKHVKFREEDKILDLGCGYGFIGIYASKIAHHPENVTMCDINEDAVKLSKYNAEHNGINELHIIKSDGLQNINEEDFSIILSNPPYHTDFSVAKGFIENGYKKLACGGRMYMVTKRKEWYKNKLISTFGGVKIVEEDDGYYVFMAEKYNDNNKGHLHKNNKKNTKGLSKKLQRKLERMHH